MRFDTSQHMKLGQHMRLAPRMIQSMEILQMPLADLEERIEQELESNVALEVVEPEPEGEEPGASVSEQARRRERLREELGRRRDNGERDAKQDAMAAAPARSEPLMEQLERQWALADVDAEVREAGAFLLGFVEDDGYMRTPLETVADRAPAPLLALAGGERSRLVALLERALVEMQAALEPPGLAARDTRECLLLQIDAHRREVGARGGDDGPLLAARRLVEQHLDDIAQNRLPRVVEKTGMTMPQVRAALEAMKGLSLAPARQLVDDAPPPIIPDAIVEYDEDSDRYVAYLNDSRLPNLRINREYAVLTRDRQMPKKDRDFLRTNIGNAQWLIDAVGQRKQTLLRVVNAVVEAQRDYFDYGPQALKPLPMTQLAEQLGIHVATVSRAVSEKHLLTPRGIVPLRRFFSGGLATESGEGMSYDAVRAALREVVEAEDKAKPLSDEALVEELAKRGIEIARRTVAKYREQLGIPSARLRRTF
ncbi:MAG: RNA polymerase factor sigma-54 [Phycisphaerae bacterium]|nr:RNA polymerase factor sigma-54 [Phycisphaerae bacterium]